MPSANLTFEQAEGEEALRALVGAYLSHIGNDTTDGELMDEAIAGLRGRPPEEITAATCRACGLQSRSSTASYKMSQRSFSTASTAP